MNDQPPISDVGDGLVPQRAERALQFGELVIHLLLHTRPGLVVVLEVGQCLLGASRERERRIDGPRHVRVR